MYACTSSTVGTLLLALLSAVHRAESLVQALLSSTCSSILFKCFTMSRDKPSSERMNTSITYTYTCTFALVLQFKLFFFSQFHSLWFFFFYRHQYQLQNDAIVHHSLPCKSRKAESEKLPVSKGRFFESCMQTAPPPDNMPTGSNGAPPAPTGPDRDQEKRGRGCNLIKKAESKIWRYKTKRSSGKNPFSSLCLVINTHYLVLGANGFY